jgi:predicted RNA-binding Zn-ribbon protein involved in translation (DUF1610 family)
MQKIRPEELRRIIQTGGVPFRETSSSFLFTCPRCSKSNKLAIHKQEGFWACYKCKEDGFKGKPENILSVLYNLPVQTIKEKLYNLSSIQLKNFLELDIKDYWEEEVSPDQFDGWVIPEVAYPSYFVGPDSFKFKYGRDYLLKKRGLNDEIIEKYGIMYNPGFKSVVFPVKYQGKLYGWQERGIESSIKMTMKGLERAKCLMFYDNLDNSEHAILSEGPVDALKLQYLGGSVCAMGKSVTDYQLDLIKSKVNKIYLALDPDAGETTRRLARDLMDSHKVFIMEPPGGKKDFGECSFDECQTAFNRANYFTGHISLNFRSFHGCR